MLGLLPVNHPLRSLHRYFLEYFKTHRTGNCVWRRFVLTVRVADGGDDGVVITGEVALDEPLSQASVRTADQYCCRGHGDMWTVSCEVYSAS